MDGHPAIFNRVGKLDIFSNHYGWFWRPCHLCRLPGGYTPYFVFSAASLGHEQRSCHTGGAKPGPKEPERAEKSAWKAARYNVVFMLAVSVFFFFGSTPLVVFMNKDAGAQKYAIETLRTVSLGYIFYGLGMVMMNAFNGAGDTKTPTIINLVCFWAFQIPLAYMLTSYWKLGPQGVFTSIVAAEVLVCIISTALFIKGKWKKVMV
jgi:Na+-driven multidrug efflux pump